MTTYKIDGKEYELKNNLTDNILSVALVAADGERVDIYAQNVVNVDGCPEWDYAGDGLFWSATQWDYDGMGKVPTPGAEKITAEDWARKTAINEVDAIIEQACNIPCDYDLNRGDLVADVSQILTEEYRLIFLEAAEQYAAARLAEEKEADE